MGSPPLSVLWQSSYRTTTSTLLHRCTLPYILHFCESAQPPSGTSPPSYPTLPVRPQIVAYADEPPPTYAPLLPAAAAAPLDCNLAGKRWPHFLYAKNAAPAITASTVSATTALPPGVRPPPLGPPGVGCDDGDGPYGVYAPMANMRPFVDPANSRPTSDSAMDAIVLPMDDSCHCTDDSSKQSMTPHTLVKTDNNKTHVDATESGMQGHSSSRRQQQSDDNTQQSAADSSQQQTTTANSKSSSNGQQTADPIDAFVDQDRQ